jgi:hypothetical protein
MIASCTTDSTGICQVGEDHGDQFIVITRLTDGLKVSYDGKFKDFKTQVRGNTDSSVDDTDTNNKAAKTQYFTITKQVNFNKVINNKVAKYTSEAGVGFSDKQNNNQGNQNNNNGGKQASVTPAATTIWSAVKTELPAAPTDTIKAAVKQVAQRNDISIPEWGITGTQNSHTLSASVLNALDLSFLSGLFK